MNDSYATVCSLLPYSLTESKPGLFPGTFHISKGPSLTVIPNNIFYLINPDPLSEAKQVHYIKVPVLALEAARSVVNDYVSALLAVEPPDRVPGIFAVSGDWRDMVQFRLRYTKEYSFYESAQRGWFNNLVMLADDTWSKSHSPVAISDLQRSACRMLELKRDWLDMLPDEQIDKCPICRNPVNVGALKCVACGFILNKIEYDKVMAATK